MNNDKQQPEAVVYPVEEPDFDTAVDELGKILNECLNEDLYEKSQHLLNIIIQQPTPTPLTEKN